MNEKKFKEKVANGLIWKFFEKIGSQGMQIIIQIIIARILMPDEYALVGLITIFITISDVFIMQGFTTALIQKKNVDETEYSSVFYANLIMSVILYAILWFVAPFVANFYASRELTLIMRVLSINVIIGAIPAVHNAVLSRNLEFRKTFYRNIFNTITQGLIGISMAVLGFGVWSMVYSKIAGTIVGAIVLWVTVRWRPSRLFSLKRLISLFSYSSKVLATNLLNTIFNNIHTLLIGKFFSKTELGYYQRGQTIPQSIMSSIDGTLAEVLYPSFSRIQDDIVALKQALRRAIETSMYIVTPILLGLMATAENLTRLLLTEKWIDSVPFMQLSCIVCLFWPFAHRTHALNAMGKSKITLAISILSKAITLIGIFVGIRYNIFSVMICTIVASLISTFVTSEVVKRIIGYNHCEFMKDVCPSLIMGACMFFIVYVVGKIQFNIILVLVLQIMVGITVYLLLSLLTKNTTFLFLTNYIKGKIVPQKS